MSMVRRTRKRLARVAGLGAAVIVLLSPSGPFLGADTVPPGGAPPPGTGPLQLEGYVRAIQGDTLDARSIRGRVAIGIVGIRAPLGNTPCGKEATAFVQALVADGAWIEEQPGLVFDARRSRRMYHVRAPDGRSIAEEMVAAGFAQADGQGRNRARLAELEADARGARRGCLWRDGTPP